MTPPRWGSGPGLHVVLGEQLWPESGGETCRAVGSTAHPTILSSCQNRKLSSSRLPGAGGEVPVGRRKECQKQLPFLEGAEHDRLHAEEAGQVGP